MNINYRRFFIIAAVVSISTPVVLRIDKIGDPVVTFNPLSIHPQYLLGYCFFALPYFVLTTMLLWSAWGALKMSKEAFYSRIAGITAIYLSYTSALIALIALACKGSAPIGAILYPVSTPVVFPILYYAGVILAKRIYREKEETGRF